MKKYELSSQNVISSLKVYLKYTSVWKYIFYKHKSLHKYTWSILQDLKYKWSTFTKCTSFILFFLKFKWSILQVYFFSGKYILSILEVYLKYTSMYWISVRDRQINTVVYRNRYTLLLPSCVNFFNSPVYCVKRWLLCFNSPACSCLDSLISGQYAALTRSSLIC